MTDLLELTFPELEAFLTDLGERPFRARQLWRWLWKKGALDFQEMTDISRKTRDTLAGAARISRPETVATQIAADGTTKFLLRLEDGALVETVLIPGARGRLTLCLSCQVGCAMGCTFCSTGAMGFERNMSMGEIVSQVLVARRYLDDLAARGLPMPGQKEQDAGQDANAEDGPPPAPGAERLRNLVFMGMGEPLLNLPNVMRALETLNDPNGLDFSPRRITVSTCGLPKGLGELGESGLAYLAVSLHAPTQALREKIMPRAAAAWPLEELVEGLRAYPLKTRERLTFEYLLLGGVNDGPEHARALVRLLSRLRGKLNLIVYNPADGLPYAAPSPERVQAFEEYLWSKNITAILRKSKGRDIRAACGQLRACVLRPGGEGGCRA